MKITEGLLCASLFLILRQGCVPGSVKKIVADAFLMRLRGCEMLCRRASLLRGKDNAPGKSRRKIVETLAKTRKHGYNGRKSIRREINELIQRPENC